jgi:hypothetical protein
MFDMGTHLLTKLNFVHLSSAMLRASQIIYHFNSGEISPKCMTRSSELNCHPAIGSHVSLKLTLRTRTENPHA